MSLLCNLTRYGGVTLPSLASDGRDLVLAVTAARYRLPHPVDPPDRPLVLDAVQPAPPLGDVYCGAPGKSGLRAEGQATYTRPATDITIDGHAQARHREPVTTMDVVVRIGPCLLHAAVVGDRIWDAGIGVSMTRMSSPEPFVTMPLVWERSFGGTVRDDGGELIDHESRNPVGRGLFRAPEAAIGQPIANIEDPHHRIRAVHDRPAPVNFGPVARWWQPRCSYAGTYDDAWRRRRAPVWPEDFDERFFCAAPAALQAVPHLRGGEPVHLEGLHPDGPQRFALPAPRMVVRFRFNGHDVYRAMVLDAVHIQPDTGHVTLIHRASAHPTPSISAHRETIIRHIEQWEDLVA